MPDRRRGTEDEGAHAVSGLVPGFPPCPNDDYATARGGVTDRGARVNGSKRCDCCNQRYEEDSTAQNNCSDQCYASGLHVGAESKFLLAPSIASYRGGSDPRCRNAFDHV